MGSIDKMLGTDRQEVTLGGKEFTLAPLTLGMMADACRYFKAAPIREFVLLCKEEDIRDDFQMRQLAQLYKELREDKRTDEEVFDKGLSENKGTGVYYAIFLMLKKDSPETTFKQFMEFPADDLNATFGVLPALGIGVSEKPEDPEKKTEPPEGSPEKAAESSEESA